MTPVPKPVRVKKAKKRVRRQKKTSRAKLVRMADALWAARVKWKGVCEFSPAGLFPKAYPHECWGPNQAQHGIGRTFHATRWELINGFEGCQKSHFYWGQHQELWGLFLAEVWGPLVAQHLWAVARENKKQDMEAVVDRLRAEPIYDVHTATVRVFDSNGCPVTA